MDKDLHHIDDLFREALEGHQEPPSPQVWEGLESDLDRKDALTYRKKFRAARRVAAILLLLLASFLLYELANRSGKNREREEVQQTSPPAQGSLQKTHPTAGQNQAASADARSMAPAGDASLTIPANSGKMRQGSRTAARPEATGTGPDSFAGNHTGQLPASARRQVSDAASTPSVRPSHSPVQGTGREIETQLPGSPAKQRNTVNALALAKQSTSLSPFFRPAPTSRDASVLNPQGPAGQPIYTQDQQPVSQLTFPGASGLDRLMVSPPHPFARFSPDASGFLAVIRGKNLLASRWSLSLVGASEWYGNRLLDDEPDFNGSGRPHDDRREIESRERKQPAMGLGLLADYRLSGRLALQTGLVYSQSVTQAGPQQIYAQPDGTGKVAYRLNLSSGYTYLKPGFSNQPAVGDSLEVTGTHDRLQFLSLPLSLHYAWTWGHLVFSPGLGFSANFILGTRLRADVHDGFRHEQEDEHRMEGMNPVSLRLVASGDLRYSLTRTWSLSFIPSFRSSLTSITQNSTVKSFPYSFSAGLGLNYRF